MAGRGGNLPGGEDAARDRAAAHRDNVHDVVILGGTLIDPNRDPGRLDLAPAGFARALTASPLLPYAGMDEAMDLRAARPEHFEPHIGSEFHLEDRGLALELAEVKRHGVQPNAPRTEPFSLYFDAEHGLPQGLVGLRHAALGRLQVFVVPIGPGPDGRHRYEAAFN